MQSEELLKLAQSSLEDMKVKDLRVLDVRGLTAVTDYLLVASGTSDRHVRSMADNLVKDAKEAGHRPIGIEEWRHSRRSCRFSVGYRNELSRLR